MSSVASTGSLKGISEPDAILCCVNADANAPQHIQYVHWWKADIETVKLHEKYCFHSEFWLVSHF